MRGVTEATSRKINLIYGIFLSVLTVAVGALFIAQVVSIYVNNASPNMYSPEIIGRYYMPVVAVPFYIWIAAAVVGFVLSELFPVSVSVKGKPDNRALLKRLSRRLPEGYGNAPFSADYALFRREVLISRIVRAVVAIVCVVSGVMCAVYLLNPANFSASDLNKDVFNMFLHVFPWLAASLFCCIAASVYESISVKRRLGAVKRLIASPPEPAQNNAQTDAQDGVQNPEKRSGFIGVCNAVARAIRGAYNAVVRAVSSKTGILVIRIAVGVVALSFLIYGAVSGGVNEVLVKAVKICMECVGLG